jgi:hypothetical protein
MVNSKHSLARDPDMLTSGTDQDATVERSRTEIQTDPIFNLEQLRHVGQADTRRWYLTRLTLRVNICAE